MVNLCGIHVEVGNLTPRNSHMPWLYYDQDPTRQEDITLRVTFDAKPVPTKCCITNMKDATHISHLEFVVAAYHLNGTFAGFQQLDSQTQICSFSGDGSADKFLRFGSYFNSDCYFDLSRLLYNFTSTLFYDLCNNTDPKNINVLQISWILITN
jgi:hypothetical protein